MIGSLTKTRRQCRFRLTDVLCPDHQQVLRQLTADLEVTGEIVFLSDRGQDPDRFAIIEVQGVLSPLIVPVDRLRHLQEENQPGANSPPRILRD